MTWQQWLDIAHACERHGVGTLLRSDHYLNLDGRHPELGSLDALGTITALGAATTSLRLGTMVSPVTFRHPSELAKLVTTADHVSGGRVELGLGAGWHEREHAAYGFQYPNLGTRMEILSEQLQILLRSWGTDPFSFDGKHYKLDRLDAQPKPVQSPHPPLLMGGTAGPVAARLAASYADKYNTTLADPTVARKRRASIVAACEAAGCEPIPFSVMTTLLVGTDETDLRARAKRIAEIRGLDRDQLLQQPPTGWIIGTIEQAAQQLRALAEVGVSRVLCQHLPHDDLEFVAILGEELTPLVR